MSLEFVDFLNAIRLLSKMYLSVRQQIPSTSRNHQIFFILCVLDKF